MADPTAQQKNEAADSWSTLLVGKVLQLAAEARSVAAAYDNDGDLDIYYCCYSLCGNAAARGRRLFGRPLSFHVANKGSRNFLLRNEGDWILKHVTKRFGLEQNNRRFSLAASWEDFDNGGDVDLYVANDFGRNNLGQILACNSDPSLRDPSKARQLAELACQTTKHREAAYLDTLAVAAAASGDFETAVERATAAVKLYEAKGSDAVRGARARLRGYREGRAYIAPAP